MYGVSTPSNAPIIFPASYTLTLFGVIGVFGVLPQRIGVAEQTAQTVAFHQIGAAIGKHPVGQLVVVVVMILLVRHIAEVQREHPTVAVDDVLRQTDQRDKQNADGCRWRLPPPPAGRGWNLRPNRLQRPPKAQNAALSNRPATQ